MKIYVVHFEDEFKCEGREEIGFFRKEEDARALALHRVKEVEDEAKRFNEYDRTKRIDDRMWMIDFKDDEGEIDEEILVWITEHEVL